ncbi:hypothetical protein ACA910_005231 [Epithemia clementina (nom. ined.)]
MPEYVRKRVEKLQELDSARESVMEQYLKERSEMEKKFAALLQPLYDQRSAVVMGEQDDEIAKKATMAAAKDTTAAAAAVGATNGDQPPGPEEVAAAAVRGIPHFWVTALSNHDTIGELITEEDVDCLQHLQDIVCLDQEDGKGFTIQFKFGPNEYFHDAVLTKTYEVPNLLFSDEPMLKQVKGCVIHWKEGNNNNNNNNNNTDRCLTYRKIQKKQRGKGKKAGQVRTITKTEKKESFFHWFETPPTMPTNMDQMEEEDVDEMEEQFTDDFEVAQALRGEICPRAVLWFTGEAAEREMLEMMAAAGEGENQQDEPQNP